MACVLIAGPMTSTQTIMSMFIDICAYGVTLQVFMTNIRHITRN